jgi:hypothetical protein
MQESSRSHRREFLQAGAAAAGAVLATPLFGQAGAVDDKPSPPRGSAQHAILLWLGGGPAQVDTFDPKRLGDAQQRVAGSYYESIETAIPGANVCRHLHRSAPLLDRAVIVRTVHHDVVDEHGAAVNRMHTGRPTSETVVYPSLGSIVASQLPPLSDTVPAYVVMGYPNVTRGPGFLGARYSYVYLTETESGPAGLIPPPGISTERKARREQILAQLRARFLQAHPDDERLQAYGAIAAQAYQLAGPEFLGAFALDREPAELREAYGSEFGQRCLLARRLVQRGVRFLEVSHNLNFLNGTGWDTHNQGQLKQHELIDELDRAFASLLTDLERHRLLDKTLLVVAGEFGRPSDFDAGGGRGHQCKTFSVVLAGGGLKTGQVVGQTDELCKMIVDRPVSVPDLFATIFCALGIDPAKELYAGDRPVPITDQGEPIREAFG